MASRFVVCTDKEEAQRHAEARLLYLSWGSDGLGYPIYEVGSLADGEAALYYYGSSAWPPEDFAYLVEEDDAEEATCPSP